MPFSRHLSNESYSHACIHFQMGGPSRNQTHSPGVVSAVLYQVRHRGPQRSALFCLANKGSPSIILITTTPTHICTALSMCAEILNIIKEEMS